MKYFPYCGGKPLSSKMPEDTDATQDSHPQKGRRKHTKKKKDTKEVVETIRQTLPGFSRQEPEPVKDDGYDGYYDDIRPLDDASQYEEIDKGMVRKLLLLAAGVLLVAGVCALLMYLL